ncbi:MAG: sensor histidine kinase [Alphaproteobacteria bacterium]|nr:sensor histidine kinase [Alphaproteobacteria bacterium]
MMRSTIFHRVKAALVAPLRPTTPEDARILEQQLDLVQVAVLPTSYVLPLAGLCIAAMFADTVPFGVHASWVGSLTLACLFGFLVRQRHLSRRKAGRAHPGVETLLQVFASGMTASIWASMAIVYWVDSDFTNHLLHILILSCSLAGAAMISASLRPVFWATVLPYVAVLNLRPMLVGDLLHLEIAGLTVAFSILMIGAGLGVHATILRGLKLQEERLALFAEVEAEREAADEARIRAEKANRSKSQFLANMSHELRTPLNAILGFSEVIRDALMGDAIDSRYRAYANDIHSSGHHLLTLINEILDLAKIEAGALVLKEEDLALRQVVDESLHFFAHRARQAGVRIEMQIDPELGLRADRFRLGQILINLVGNALKFTPSGGIIAVTAAPLASGETAVWISDTGCGIAPGDLERVFENFGQARHDIAANDRGTGLGLPIVRGLMDAHGGSISLESELQRGTTITLIFPENRTFTIPQESRAAAS